jgi:hypothetical protein
MLREVGMGPIVAIPAGKFTEKMGGAHSRGAQPGGDAGMWHELKTPADLEMLH